MIETIDIDTIQYAAITLVTYSTPPVFDAVAPVDALIFRKFYF